MSCGRTANCEDFLIEPDAGGSMGFLAYIPPHFTRYELRELLKKARDLVQYGVMDEVKRDLLEDLAETLDLLDAMEARVELDLKELEESIEEHMPSAPLPPTIEVRQTAHRCCPHCPCPPRPVILSMQERRAGDGGYGLGG